MDFGYLVHRTPREVVHPGSAGEAAEAVLRAGPAASSPRVRGVLTPQMCRSSGWRRPCAKRVPARSAARGNVS